MAKALELFGGEEASETAIMADKFNHFFDCLNVSNFTAGKRSRDPFKSPYRSGTDFRLKVCMGMKCVCGVCACFFSMHVVAKGRLPWLFG